MSSDPTPRPVPPQVLVKAPGGRALLFEYREGEGLPPHTHARQAVVVAVLRGRLRLSVDGQARDVPAGEVLQVETTGLFSSRALEDGTRVLVTLLELT
ncbi:cupin domain-containing protein [Deinococcus sp. MIMF12]|uniref:Cupin domain-containing protein n=1 Tax=Deinococcus rhizophilus TaxID=3049544 RepID=A0ABT7JIH3_9DEIO|nr:cupin domain-containing protein [Deinococcus rhizophilus]MDL2344859.1 cupin domain-containing protein [Deinococcus rhizophilus]